MPPDRQGRAFLRRLYGIADRRQYHAQSVTTTRRALDTVVLREGNTLVGQKKTQAA